MGISFAESAAPAICPQNQLSAEKTLFGYIKPNIPELRVREKARYDAWYCGLCRRLGARYGTAARALLSFDCTFLALLAASVSGEDSPEDLLRCPFKPFGKKRAMLGSPSAALDFAADVCVILSEFKLSDDIADGKPLRIAAKLPLLCAFKKARLHRPEVYAAVKKHMRELASVEAPYRGSRAFPRRKAAKNDSAAELRSPDLPANIFGEMLRDVLASAPVPKKEIPALKETGFFIGRFIYLCDAWDDRESDKKHSLFNPFNICGCTRDDAEFIINISINSAISAYNLLSTGRDRAILDNILFQGLFAVSDAVFAKEKQPLPNDGITTAAHKA